MHFISTIITSVPFRSSGIRSQGLWTPVDQTKPDLPRIPLCLLVLLMTCWLVLSHHLNFSSNIPSSQVGSLIIRSRCTPCPALFHYLFYCLRSTFKVSEMNLFIHLPAVKHKPPERSNVALLHLVAQHKNVASTACVP